jgi:Ran GTPase-activating protein (RanGAP) involved in mRNA processing and transport
MNISPELIQDLQAGLIGCPSLQHIDMSYNSMSDGAGSMFGKILKAQADMRDQYIWMASLRGRVTLAAREIGLQEFHLRCNKLGALAAETFAKIIEGDEYLRVLDFSFNSIPSEAMEEHLLPSLRQNKTLTNVDLRENPGFNKKVRKLTALCLLRNIDIMKRQALPSYAIGKNWLNPDVLLPRSQTPNMNKLFETDPSLEST